ncbi:calcium/sodium antiporter [Alteromonas ponticola]|uniref:Calcium/sodium antiporter n=1 Tax=Alteromonas aquimaris TaxID=2998417 RepID=A0ABT3P7A2_9ALTE|nr:calcium/sodium antiporter [Alteromonas aquimaris]MCW8107956.1 calcium/sodium antiporter [Alteromonas aquimaris]
MLLASISIIVGLIFLVWSADRFVEGAAASAHHAGLSPLLIGMVIVGFGTSAPEMVVSAIAASEGNVDLSLGNALGSNIVNIGLIIGITALIAPIVVKSTIVKKELPILLGVVLLCGALLFDNTLSTLDALLLLSGFALFIVWSISSGKRHANDALNIEFSEETNHHKMGLPKAVFWLVAGLILLIISSRALVWGAVEVASTLGVSDLIIGLTIVAIGTSLPELATSFLAARKGEHDIAIGNVVGSNIFNILAVIGIAAVISPATLISSTLFTRDWLIMLIFTIALTIMAIGIGRQGRINRLEGSLLLVAYIAYNSYLVVGA